MEQSIRFDIEVVLIVINIVILIVIILIVIIKSIMKILRSREEEKTLRIKRNIQLSFMGLSEIPEQQER